MPQNTEFLRLTRAEVDFLCAAYRIAPAGAVPVRTIAGMLSVFPAAAGHLAQSLAGRGYVRLADRGTFSLTEAGARTAAYHVRRRGIAAAFADWVMAGTADRAVCVRLCELVPDEAIDAMEARLATVRAIEEQLAGSRESVTRPRIDFMKS